MSIPAILKINSVNMQRNGICGEPFYTLDAIWAVDGGERHMLFFSFADDDNQKPAQYGIVDIDNTSISWRGDHFADIAWTAIQNCLRCENLIDFTHIQSEPKQATHKRYYIQLSDIHYLGRDGLGWVESLANARSFEVREAAELCIRQRRLGRKTAYEFGNASVIYR